MQENVMKSIYRLPNVKKKHLLDPHVVVVGAGASVAACKIDKNGKEVPLLRNIHHVLGFMNNLSKYKFSKELLDDCEALYSYIYGKSKYEDLQKQLEYKITEYFGNLQIPDKPTLYDYLILSLTEKDAIISFNWDPFLIQAYRRNISIKNLPNIIFPHGNSGVGLCYGCKFKGYSRCICPKCFKDLEPMPLLYPVDKKNYNSIPIIKNEWNLAKDFLSRAAGITVYGYGAPSTDVEAVKLMKSAFEISETKRIAPFTIINLSENEKEQKRKWANFYDEKMIHYCNSFEESGVPKIYIQIK